MKFIHLIGKNSFAIWMMLLLCALNYNSVNADEVEQSFPQDVLTNNRTTNPKMKDQYVDVENLKLHYVETGSGRPVVLIHGNAGSIHDFEFGTFALMGRNYRTIAFDLPGHGASERRENTMPIDEQAAILHRALDEIGVKNPILVGHSWGGAVVMAYALLYPKDVAGLVLLAPAAYPDSNSQSRFAALLNIPIVGDLCLAIVKPMVSLKILKSELEEAFYPDKVPQDYFKAAKKEWLGSKQIKIFVNDEQELNQSLPELSSKYSSLHLPMVIVTGDSDRMVLPQENAYLLHQAIPRSKLIVLHRTGHQIPETHPEAILRAVRTTVSTG